MSVVTLAWFLSIILAGTWANEKKQNVVLFLFLGLVLGPFALLILLALPKRESFKRVGQSSGQPKQSPGNLHDEVRALRSSLLVLQDRIRDLEIRVGLEGKADLPRGAEPLGRSARPVQESLKHESLDQEAFAAGAGVVKGGAELPAEEKDRSAIDFEMILGRNWLSRIGIIVFTLGIVFLIGYTFKYFGPAVKILFGYFVGGAFVWAGKSLEKKERFVNFGQVLWGGGWGILYFTTYAAHHFEASRIFADPYLCLGLQGLLVMALIGYVSRYRNENMMSVALFVSYIAITFGQVTNFTLLSCLFLAGVVLFLVYRFVWVKTLAVAMVLTTAIQQFWVSGAVPSVAGNVLWWSVPAAMYAPVLNFVLLSGCALMFLAAAHIARTEEREDLKDVIGAINAGNIGLYSVFAYPLIGQLFPQQKFSIVIGLGLAMLGLAWVMRSFGRTRLYQSDMIAGLIMMTFSLPLRFPEMSWLLAWMVQVPFLLVIGLRFKERLYTASGMALMMLLFWNLLFFEGGGKIDLRFVIMWARDFLLLCGAVSMAVSYAILARQEKCPSGQFKEFKYCQYAASAAGFFYVILTFYRLAYFYLSFALLVLSVGLLFLSAVLKRKHFRLYAYVALMFGAFLSMSHLGRGQSLMLQWMINLSQVLILTGYYYAVRLMTRKGFLSSLGEFEVPGLFLAAGAVMFAKVFNFVPEGFVSLGLGLLGVFWVIAGVIAKERIQRLGGLFLLGVTIFRIVFNDLAGKDVIFKIVSFIVLGLLFLGASYVYNRWDPGKKEA